MPRKLATVVVKEGIQTIMPTASQKINHKSEADNFEPDWRIFIKRREREKRAKREIKI